MSDMTATTGVKSDQINAIDLFGAPITVTIDRVSIDMSADQPVAIKLVGMEKVYRPCKVMRRVLMQLWGPDANVYAGRAMTLYCDPTVRFGKDQTGGSRISHMTHMDGPVTITMMVSKGKFQPHRILPLVVAAVVAKDAPAVHVADALVQDEARTVARRGTDAFKAWWTAQPDKRTDAKLIMDELKGICAAADAAAKAADADIPLDDESLPM